MKLADLQAAFQSAILNGGDEVMPLIPDSPLEKKDVLFGVYRDGYVLRLQGILMEDFGRVHAYAGDEIFDRLTRDYIAANPSHTRNARYYGTTFPAYLTARADLATKPMVAALARLEGALNEIFDCADAAPLELSALAQFSPHEFDKLIFAPHPSVRRFDAFVNLDEVFTALTQDDTPPLAAACDPAQHFLVWRKDVVPHYRVLAPEEAMMWDEAAKGVRFGVLCELLATYDDAETAPLRAAQYLQSWIAGGQLASART